MNAPALRAVMQRRMEGAGHAVRGLSHLCLVPKPGRTTTYVQVIPAHHRAQTHGHGPTTARL